MTDRTTLLNILAMISQGETDVINHLPYNIVREYSLLSRLKFELYCEYPLSPENEDHFNTYIEPVFNLSDYYRERANKGLDLHK